MASPEIKSMSIEEFISLPDDGMHRELLLGELRERAMTVRNSRHAQIEARLAQLLNNWLDDQPEPHGCVYSGEVGCILQRNPNTVVGVDVAYVSARTAERSRQQASTLVDGAPLLAVEILSPSDTHESIVEKTDRYLAAGTAVVWVVDPDRDDTLECPDALPDFAVAMQRIFA